MTDYGDTPYGSELTDEQLYQEIRELNSSVRWRRQSARETGSIAQQHEAHTGWADAQQELFIEVLTERWFRDLEASVQP